MGTWTIRTRLLSAFGTGAAITLALGAGGYYTATQGRAALEEVGTVRLPSIQALLTVSEAQTAVDAGENALLARGAGADLRRQQYARFDAARQRADRALAVYAPLPQTPEEALVWKRFEPAWAKWWADHETYVRIAREFEAEPTDANYERMSTFALVTIGESFGKAEAELNELVRINEVVAEQATATSVGQARYLQFTMLGVACLGVVVAIALGTYISLALNRVLSARIAELRQGAEQVAAASSQVSHASQALSQGATEQAASIEETSASMEEMASMTRSNAESASKAAGLMGDVDRRVTEANAVLADLVRSMATITDSSSRVSKIIKTIDEIAFQTNILALNAAVEAARAGSAGMGFAVVADEVRNLAQRAAGAARDTTSLIEESGRSAREGSSRVEAVTAAVASFTGSIAEVRSIAEHVSAASQRQSQGFTQVSQAIGQMEKVTQTTAATAEESAAASEELNAQAEQSMSVVRQLEALVGGAAPAGVPDRTRRRGEAAQAPAETECYRAA